MRPRKKDRRAFNKRQRYIPLRQCVHRSVYRIYSRNLSVGVFNRYLSGFEGIRTKYGERFLFIENHWDTGAPFGTVKPIKQVCRLPDNIVFGSNELFRFLAGIPGRLLKSKRVVTENRKQDTD